MQICMCNSLDAKTKQKVRYGYNYSTKTGEITSSKVPLYNVSKYIYILVHTYHLTLAT